MKRRKNNKKHAGYAQCGINESQELSYPIPSAVEGYQSPLSRK
jgi:hypothetical protein